MFLVLGGQTLQNILRRSPIAEQKTKLQNKVHTMIKDYYHTKPRLDRREMISPGDDHPGSFGKYPSQNVADAGS